MQQQAQPLSRISARLRSVSGATLALMLTGILSRVVTLMTQMVIASEFGVSVFSDAYFATENVPELFIEFISIGFSMAFIPMFMQYRVDRGDDDAWRFASSFLALSTVISVGFALVAGLGAPLLIGVIAPGFTEPARDIAIDLIRIMALAIILLGLDAGLRGLLHSHEEFIVPELARMAYNLVLLGVAWSLGGSFGIYVLAWGIVFGALAQLLIQLGGVWRRGLIRRSWAWRHPGMLPAIKALPPFLVAIAGVDVLLLLNQIVASWLATGSITALAYAARIILLPIGIFVLPVRTTLYPTMTDLAVRQQFEKLAETMALGLRMLLFIVIPACVGLVVLREPLIRLLFERGAFDAAATLATSEALLFYAAGVPAIAVIFFIGGVYFSLGEALLLMKITLASWGGNYLLTWSLSGVLGVAGIALGTAIVTTLTASLMVVLLKRKRLPTLRLRSLLRSVGKMCAASAGMGLVLLWLVSFIQSALTFPSSTASVVLVAAALPCGAASYGIAALALKVDEMHTVVAAVRKFAQR